MYVYCVVPVLVCRNEAMPYLSNVLAISGTFSTSLRSVKKSFYSSTDVIQYMNIREVLSTEAENKKISSSYLEHLGTIKVFKGASYNKT